MSVCTLKKALKLSAFFIGLVFVRDALAAVPENTHTNCRTTSYDDVATVLRVVDGDTLVLTDKRKVRFIGVNAPELAHYPKKEDPLAQKAKQFIQSLLSESRKVLIKYGDQKRDRYGRILAHLFLSDGRNMSALLVERGLASAIVVPPNLQFRQCYFSLEKRARKNLLQRPYNLWSEKFYHYRQAESIDNKTTGFRFIKGKVRRIGRSRDSIWLQLAEKFTIRIKRKDFKYFKNFELRKLKLKHISDKMIYIRGWVYEWKNEFYIQLRHPDMFNKDILKY